MTEGAFAAAFHLREGDIVVSIHCGSRGLGHQIGTDFLKRMTLASPTYGIDVPDRELACAPIDSLLGQAYLGAMRAAINCALANMALAQPRTGQGHIRSAARARWRRLRGAGAASRGRGHCAAAAADGAAASRARCRGVRTARLKRARGDVRATRRDAVAQSCRR